MISQPYRDAVATVHLFLRVPVPLDTGGWQWGEMAEYRGVLARDYANTASEVQALVHAYGRILKSAAHVSGRPALGERFSIQARGPVTGMTLGLREWAWSPADRAYVRVGEYWDGFRAAARQYFRITGRLVGHETYDASLLATGGIPVLHLPITPRLKSA